MNASSELVIMDFCRYPPIGEEDWEYAFSTAQVRVLESMMLRRGTLVDMINSESFEDSVELLTGSEYAVASGTDFSGIGSMLLDRRSDVRNLFTELMLDENIVELLRAREDFANMRLAVRRVVTEKAIGVDYSNDGSVPAEEFEEIFEQEDYGRFPKYLQEAVEQAVLGYYENKDIRQIDHGIDRAQADYKINKATDIGSVFLKSLFRTQIDLTNIRTMLRQKLAEQEDRTVFLNGGYVDVEKFIHGLHIGYEAIGPLFYSTPYNDVVEPGVNYLNTEKSFLRLEKECENHLMCFLRTTSSLASGPQPVIAYLLMKEAEIRTVRMILTGKKNNLDSKLLLERLGEWN